MTQCEKKFKEKRKKYEKLKIFKTIQNGRCFAKIKDLYGEFINPKRK